MNLKQTIKGIRFAVGLPFLLYGTLNFGIQDWHVGVSLTVGSQTSYDCRTWRWQ